MPAHNARSVRLARDRAATLAERLGQARYDCQDDSLVPARFQPRRDESAGPPPEALFLGIEKGPLRFPGPAAVPFGPCTEQSPWIEPRLDAALGEFYGTLRAERPGGAESACRH